jgi:hypothetical protein
MKSIKMRVWSDDEVADMKNYIIERDPDLWKRMQEIEKGDGDYRNTEEHGQALKNIFERHASSDGPALIELFSELRCRLRRDLGLK